MSPQTQAEITKENMAKVTHCAHIDCPKHTGHAFQCGMLGGIIAIEMKTNEAEVRCLFYDKTTNPS